MSRPTSISIDTNALLHNLDLIKQKAPNKQIVAMVKANAYGCGLEKITNVLENQVDGFGVACLEEALYIRKLGLTTNCVLFGGVFCPEELHLVVEQQFSCVVHQRHHLRWILNTPLPTPIKLWVKIDTGMHRLGFLPEEGYQTINALKACPWVDPHIVVFTHFASADENNITNANQLELFNEFSSKFDYPKSLANSAAILSLPEAHGDIIRPGIILYGVSPFFNKTGNELGLKPVMSLTSEITAINNFPIGEKIGYGATWVASRASRIAIVPVGYGDGYPRHINSQAHVLINNEKVPIVGRVSMDMLTLDVTDFPSFTIGDKVELWGKNLSIEQVAQFANTIAYELLCQCILRVGTTSKNFLDNMDNL